MSDAKWKQKLERFFYDRALLIDGEPTLKDHCMVSAKDPRFSTQPDFHADLIDSLFDQMKLDQNSNILEVGCASGYIACGLAPKVGRYTGVDLAATPIIVARKMNLPNAEFQQADGEKLPFDEGHFDAAFACDVFSNFPSFAEAAPSLVDMVRVVRPGGRILVGSVTDASRAEEFQQHVYAVASKLEAEFGPPEAVPGRKIGLLAGFARRLRGFLSPPPSEPQIINYNFNRSEFQAFGVEHRLSVAIDDVHAMNPYIGYRYNVIYTK